MNNLTLMDSKPYGPAMQKLSEQRRAFVVARVWKGFNQTESARDAGYSPSGNTNSLAVIGHDLVNDPRIIEAIREETNKLKDSEGANSLRTLIEIRDDPTAEKSVRRKCAVDILDRAGYHATTEHRVAVTHKEETTEEVVKSITQMALRLGIDPVKLLGSAVIDATYEELPNELPRELTEVEQKQRTARERENELRRIRRGMTPEQLAAHKAQTRAEKSARCKTEYQQQQNGGTVVDESPIADNPVFDENSIDDIL